MLIFFIKILNDYNNFNYNVSLYRLGLKMAENIKVYIRGHEYALRGEDESLIRHAAEDVDNEIKSLEISHLNHPAETVAILAALNIAEKRYVSKRQKDIDENYLVTELDRMAKSIVVSISDERAV
jgi:cell division protein ZapA (FtsZ GTPase activity inhibitor)